MSIVEFFQGFAITLSDFSILSFLIGGDIVSLMEDVKYTKEHKE